MTRRRRRSYFVRCQAMATRHVCDFDLDALHRRLWHRRRSISRAWYTLEFRDDTTIRQQVRDYTRHGKGLIRLPRRDYLCGGAPPRHAQLPTHAIASLTSVGEYSAVYGIMLSGSCCYIPMLSRSYIAMFSVAVNEITWYALQRDTTVRCVTRFVWSHIFGRGVPR